MQAVGKVKAAGVVRGLKPGGPVVLLGMIFFVLSVDASSMVLNWKGKERWARNAQLPFFSKSCCPLAGKKKHLSVNLPKTNVGYLPAV